MVELLRLCLKLDATYKHPSDLEWEPLTDAMPESFRELIENILPEYCPIKVYTAPDKEKIDLRYMCIIGHKDRQWYALSFGLSSGNYETCMALLREAADKRRQPWNYWETGKRGWTIAAGLLGVASVALAAFLTARLGASADVLWVIFAQMALGVSIASALIVGPKTYWEQCGRQIEDLLGAIPA